MQKRFLLNFEKVLDFPGEKCCINAIFSETHLTRNRSSIILQQKFDFTVNQICKKYKGRLL